MYDGKNLKRERQKIGITMEELAKQVGVTQAQISFYERNINKPSIEKLEALARALNIPISKLLDEDVTLSIGVIDMTIGKRLRKIRVEQGLTTVELGMRANISQGMISRIENDRANPTIDKVVSLARALNIPISKLLDEDVTLYQPYTLKKEEQDLLHYYRLVDTSEKAMIINVARVTYEAHINGHTA